MSNTKRAFSRRQFLKSSVVGAAGAGILTHCDGGVDPALSSTTEPSAYLIVNGLVVTMDPERRVITEGAVAVNGNQIEAVGKTEDLRQSYGAYHIIDAGKGIIMPGLVNAHSHLFAMFSRGLGSDGGAPSSRSNYRWDVDKSSQYDKALCRASADLAAIEMIRAGITTTQDSHYINFHLDGIDGVAESVEQSGLRAVIGRGCWNTPGLAPPEMTEDVDSAIAETERFVNDWNGKGNGRINARVEASMLAQCTDEMMRATKDLANRLGVGWATHLQYRLAVSSIDPRQARTDLERFEGRAVEYMEELGVLGPDSLLVHCTFIDDKEIEILAKTGTPVAHCPLANAITGNPRVTRIPEMNQAGVTVGLGTDSVSTNDSLDLFQVMKTAAMIHRVHRGSVEVINAEKLIEMSTIESAKALQLDDEVGSLEAGKKADVIVFKRDVPGLNPILNPIKNIVYATGCNRSVDTVMVDGKILLGDGKITTMDESKVYERIEEVALELNGKLGRLDEYSLLNTSPWRFS